MQNLHSLKSSPRHKSAPNKQTMQNEYKQNCDNVCRQQSAMEKNKSINAYAWHMQEPTYNLKLPFSAMVFVLISMKAGFDQNPSSFILTINVKEVNECTMLC